MKEVRKNIVEVMIFSFKVLSLGVWFIFFVILVKPEITRLLIPRVIEISNSYSQAREGIDLDPIVLAADSTSSSSQSSLYSTKFDFDQSIYGDLVTSDTRVIALNRFLVRYNSPMAPYAETFVTSADDVGLDWRLVAAISGVESGFGLITPYNSNNAWGWRGGPGGAFSIFDSWEDGITHVTTRIAVGYGTNIDVFVMEPVYCPPCGQNPAHAWANGVQRYMSEISQYRSNL